MNPKTYLEWVGKKPAPQNVEAHFKLKVHRVAGYRWFVLDEKGNGAVAEFSKCKTALTIFECELIYCAFLKRRQRDYANFHKCGAGQQFFADLDKLYVIKPKVVEEKVMEEIK